MKVEIERFDSPGGILRVWLSPDARPGIDQYQLAMTVEFLDDGAIEFKGLQNPFAGPLGKAIQEEAARNGIVISDEVIEFLRSRKPISKDMWKAIQDECARQGIQRIRAIRMNTGERREEWIKTKRRRDM